MDGLEVRREVDSGPTVVVAGSLDILSVAQLETELQRLRFAHQDVCLDLRGLTFCDSSGVQALLTGYRKAVDDGLKFEITAASSSVLRLLDVTGLRPTLGPPPD